MAKSKPLTFTVQIDSSVKLSAKARSALSKSLGSAALSEIARLDVSGPLAFVNSTDWRGGKVVNLHSHISASQLQSMLKT